jgi:hypothetical protein
VRRAITSIRLVTISALFSAVLACVLLLSSPNRATAGESFVLHRSASAAWRPMSSSPAEARPRARAATVSAF